MCKFDFKSFVSGFVLGVFLIHVLALFVLESNDWGWQYKIIEKGYGLYCPADAKFAFIGECDK